MTTAKADVESARLSGLALALDDGTRKSHSVAQNTAFVTGFFRGIATTTSYAQLLSSLFFVYEAMENAMDETVDLNVKAMDFPELRRVQALEEDMLYFFGDNWRAEVEPSRATQEYVERIEQVAREEPYLLVGHMYTRYLGDLFGGQMMMGMARRSLELDAGKGTAFYQFDDVPETKQFIESWYRDLNKLDLSDDEKKAIVDEANLVFALNIKVFDDVDGSPTKALWSLAKSSLRSALGL